MVSWDMKVKFLGFSPNIKELLKLAKEQKFSNIESIEQTNERGIYYLVVNNRGLNQKKIVAEIIEEH